MTTEFKTSDACLEGILMHEEPFESVSIDSNRQQDQSENREMDILSIYDALREILVDHNQNASVQLQHQLKCGSFSRKRLIFEAMSSLMIPLAINQFGHFLVNRAIGYCADTAQHLSGAFVLLALSPVGVHVVSHVLDGPEVWKIQVVRELLQESLLITLTTQHSQCLWHKILQMRWSDPSMPLEIRESIHDALRGRWASFANTETGSTLCQHLYDSKILCDMDDGMQELLQELVGCVCDPWGVWVIQHLLEHGSVSIREYIAQCFIVSAATVSLSSYGSKAVQCALRYCGESFQNQYADVLCRVVRAGHDNVRSGGARRPLLVDVAATQHGLPILSLLLTTILRAKRTHLVDIIRVNASYLRRNRSGTRVVQLCGMYAPRKIKR